MVRIITSRDIYMTTDSWWTNQSVRVIPTNMYVKKITIRLCTLMDELSYHHRKEISVGWEIRWFTLSAVCLFVSPSVYDRVCHFWLLSILTYNFSLIHSFKKKTVKILFSLLFTICNSCCSTWNNNDSWQNSNFYQKSTFMHNKERSFVATEITVGYHFLS